MGILGVLVVTKSRNPFLLILSLSALVVLSLAGCGGGSSANVVTVAVSPSSATIIVSQSITLNSVVSGATDLNVTWACTFTTTTIDSTGKPTTAAEQPCTADTGGIPANSANTTVIYTAPNKVPDPKKFPLLQVIITAKSVQDPKKTGKATLSLDSGISVTLTPTTATVPTSVSSTQQSQFQFSATLANDNDPQLNGVTWLVTQGTPTTNIPYPSLPSCSVSGNASGCGSIDASGLYTAPTAVPTTASLTVVVTSKADPSRFAIGTVTVIQGGPISLNRISPTVVPQGASFYDIYIEAANMTSASSITLTNSGGAAKIINSASGQIKILFPIPTSTVANPASTGARLRLTVQDLQFANTFTVSIADPAECPGGCPLSSGHGPVSFQVLPVRPTSVATLPDSVPQHSLLPNELSLSVDGGYFGPNGSLAKITFNGNDLATDATNSSSRQLRATLDSSKVSSALPGLYPFTVSRTTAPLPSPANPSVTNIAVFPDYSTVPPSLIGTVNLGAGTSPSAVDIDTRLGILAVAEAGSNLVQFFAIGAATGTLTPLPCPVTSCAVHAPTGLSINQSNHTVAVVSPQDQSVVVLPLPGSAGVTGVTYPLTISLTGLLPSEVSPLPLPYAVGVDPDTNMALVAYSSSANPTTAKVGFLLDLNKDTQTCLSGSAPPCPHAQVTLNTGSFPQIAMLPHSHLALVTPGGTGVLNGIDVTKSSASVPIANVSLTSGLVTVSTPSDKPHGLNPGNPGTVLIQGVPPGSQNQTAFNGAFTVQSVINSTSFTYALNASVNDTSAGDSDSFGFSSPNITIGISQTTQGIAINPITRVAAIADANATGSNGPEINLLNSLDQSISSITFHAGCTAFTTSCSNAPELLGTTAVAFQPYTNSLIS